MNESVVETSHGKVRGAVGDGIRAFKGIPYGASTAGDRRFRAPAPPEPWTGEHDAREYASSAPQLTPEQSIQTNPWQRWAMTQVAASVVPRRLPPDRQGEDCLVLNVFTPGTDDARRPVMVWLHGGAWVAGRGTEPWFDGTNLACRGDVVVVTVNHRLGLLGYLNLSGHAGDEYQESGYAGVLDLVAALRWVRDNIAAFGGDAGNVTIFGQSGGGEKVAALLSTPAAAGLFHKAVMQSSLGGRSFLSPAFSLQLADETIRELGISQVGELLELPVQRLVETQATLMQRAFARALTTSATGVRPQFHEGMIFGPVWPGTGVAGPASIAAAATASANVPLLIGTVADETALTLPALSLPALHSRNTAEANRVDRALGPVLGHCTADIVSAYRSRCPNLDSNDLITAVTTDHGFRIPTIRFAQRRSAAVPASVYAYLVTWGVPVTSARPAAPHCIDIPLVFNNLDHSPFWPAGTHSGARMRMAAAVSDAWIAFARTGKPHQLGVPDWPPYLPDRRSTMVIDDTSYVAEDPRGHERQVWDSFGDSQLGLAGEFATSEAEDQ